MASLWAVVRCAAGVCLQRNQKARPLTNVTCFLGAMQVLETYRVVGQLLLRLRRVAAALEGAWSGMRAGGRAARSVALPPQAKPLWHLRAQMAHFVACYQHYLQVAGGCECPPHPPPPPPGRTHPRLFMQFAPCCRPALTAGCEDALVGSC